MILGIHHVGVSVSDLDRFAAFYAGAFGLRETFRFPLRDSPEGRAMLQLPMIGGQAAFIAGPNLIVEVFQFDAPRPSGRAVDRPVNLPGITHFCVQSNDMPSAAARFSAAGGRFDAEPTDLGADITYAYPRDPDGNVIELEALPDTGEEGCWPAHVSITTPDVDRAVEFYERLTGVTARRLRQVGPNKKVDQVTGLEGAEASGAWLQIGNLQLELWQYMSPPSDEVEERNVADFGYSHFALEVDDVEAERRRAEQLGMQFQGAPIRSGGVTATYGRDADGNVVEFIAFDADARRHSIGSLSDPGIVGRVESRRAAQRAAR
jgi:catechol 2,3-dioxygenase-like lactoylglutathione lyase family enzyme